MCGGAGGERYFDSLKLLRRIRYFGKISEFPFCIIKLDIKEKKMSPEL